MQRWRLGNAKKRVKIIWQRDRKVCESCSRTYWKRSLERHRALKKKFRTSIGPLPSNKSWRIKMYHQRFPTKISNQSSKTLRIMRMASWRVQIRTMTKTTCLRSWLHLYRRRSSQLRQGWFLSLKLEFFQRPPCSKAMAPLKAKSWKPRNNPLKNRKFSTLGWSRSRPRHERLTKMPRSICKRYKSCHNSSLRVRSRKEKSMSWSYGRLVSLHIRTHRLSTRSAWLTRRWWERASVVQEEVETA